MARNRSHFAIAFDGAMDVSIEPAAKQLLQPSSVSEGIVDDVMFELYKLNVYGGYYQSTHLVFVLTDMLLQSRVLLQISQRYPSFG